MKHILANLFGFLKLTPKVYFGKKFHVKQLDEPTADDIACAIIGGALLVLLFAALACPF